MLLVSPASAALTTCLLLQVVFSTGNFTDNRAALVSVLSGRVPYRLSHFPPLTTISDDLDFLRVPFTKWPKKDDAVLIRRRRDDDENENDDDEYKNYPDYDYYEDYDDDYTYDENSSILYENSSNETALISSTETPAATTQHSAKMKKTLGGDKKSNPIVLTTVATPTANHSEEYKESSDYGSEYYENYSEETNTTNEYSNAQKNSISTTTALISTSPVHSSTTESPEKHKGSSDYGNESYEYYYEEDDEEDSKTEKSTMNTSVSLTTASPIREFSSTKAPTEKPMLMAEDYESKSNENEYESEETDYENSETESIDTISSTTSSSVSVERDDATTQSSPIPSSVESATTEHSTSISQDLNSSSNNSSEYYGDEYSSEYIDYEDSEAESTSESSTTVTAIPSTTAISAILNNDDSTTANSFIPSTTSVSASTASTTVLPTSISQDLNNSSNNSSEYYEDEYSSEYIDYEDSEAESSSVSSTTISVIPSTTDISGILENNDSTTENSFIPSTVSDSASTASTTVLPTFISEDSNKTSYYDSEYDEDEYSSGDTDFEDSEAERGSKSSTTVTVIPSTTAISAILNNDDLTTENSFIPSTTSDSASTTITTEHPPFISEDSNYSSEYNDHEYSYEETEYEDLDIESSSVSAPTTTVTPATAILFDNTTAAIATATENAASIPDDLNEPTERESKNSSEGKSYENLRTDSDSASSTTIATVISSTTEGWRRSSDPTTEKSYLPWSTSEGIFYPEPTIEQDALMSEELYESLEYDDDYDDENDGIEIDAFPSTTVASISTSATVNWTETNNPKTENAFIPFTTSPTSKAINTENQALGDVDTNSTTEHSASMPQDLSELTESNKSHKSNLKDNGSSAIGVTVVTPSISSTESISKDFRNYEDLSISTTTSSVSENLSQPSESSEYESNETSYSDEENENMSATIPPSDSSNSGSEALDYSRDIDFANSDSTLSPAKELEKIYSLTTTTTKPTSSALPETNSSAAAAAGTAVEAQSTTEATLVTAGEENDQLQSDYDYFVTENGTACIMMRLSATFYVEYKTLLNKTYKAHVTIPSNGTACGSCDEVDSYIIISWPAPSLLRNNSVKFMMEKHRKSSYTVAKIVSVIYRDKFNFPESRERDTPVVAVFNELGLFKTPIEKSFFCNKTENLLFSKGVTLQLTSIHFKAFNGNANTSTIEDFHCQSINKDLITICVGASVSGIAAIFGVFLLLKRMRYRGRCMRPQLP